jgi:hypothetical protein
LNLRIRGFLAKSPFEILLDRQRREHRAIDSKNDRFLTAIAPQLARPTGLEPATVGLEGRCSIRLSYGRISSRIAAKTLRHSLQTQLA